MTTTATHARLAFYETHRHVVVEACHYARTEPVRVVVLADLQDTSGRNLATGAGASMAERHAVVGNVWVAVFERQRLAALLSIVWPEATGTRGVLEIPPAAGDNVVWVWIVAHGGCQLLQTLPGDDGGGTGQDFDHNPLSIQWLKPDGWHQSSVVAVAPAGNASRVGDV